MLTGMIKSIVKAHIMGLNTENLLKALRTDIFFICCLLGICLGVLDVYCLLMMQTLYFGFHSFFAAAMLLIAALKIEEKFLLWAIAISVPNLALIFVVAASKGIAGQFLWGLLAQIGVVLVATAYQRRLSANYVSEAEFGKLQKDLKDSREHGLARLLNFSVIGCMKEKQRVISQAYHVLQEVFKVDKAVIFLADYEKNALVPFAGKGLLNDKNTGSLMVTPDFWERYGSDPEKGILNAIGGRANLPSLRQLIPGADLDAIAVMPLSSGGKVNGLIAVIKQKAENRHYLEPELFATFAYVLASAIENCSIHEMHINMLDGAQKKSQDIEASFSKYVSKAVIDELTNSKNLAVLGGKKCNVTIMMADLRGFTSLTGVLNIEYLFQLLNGWFEEASVLILKNQGTIDKYMGDCIMVMFGAPLPKPDDPLRCVYTAFRLQEKFELFNKNLKLPQGKTLGLGISITSGEAVVGNFGSSKRMEYTAIGDVVNLAARLEKVAEAGEIVVDESTFRQVPPNRFKYVVEKDFALKGIANQTIYRLTEIIQTPVSED